MSLALYSLIKITTILMVYTALLAVPQKGERILLHHCPFLHVFKGINGQRTCLHGVNSPHCFSPCILMLCKRKQRIKSVEPLQKDNSDERPLLFKTIFSDTCPIMLKSPPDQRLCSDHFCWIFRVVLKDMFHRVIIPES